MTLSLRSRLFALHALVVAAALAIVTVLAIRAQRAWLIEHHFEDLERTAARVAAALPADPAARPGGIPALADTLGTLLGVRVTLLDGAGQVRGDSEVPRAALAAVENHAGRPEVRAALAGAKGRAIRHSHTIGVDLLYVATPLRGVAGLAVLRLAEPRALLTGLHASLLGIAVVTALAALLFSVPLVLWVTGRHVARLAQLERTANRQAQGETGVRARELPADELGRLGRAINAMAAERRARLASLERERDERERILAHMTDGVALLEADGRVAHMNRRFAELLGRPLSPPAGTPLAHFARAPELEDLLERARGGDRTLEAEIRLWAPHPRPVRATITPLVAPEPDGRRGGMLIVLHDLSDLESLNRLRQDFVANAAHELRTPLTSLRGYADTLLDGGLEDLERREGFLRVIRDQAVRLEALVADLLSLAELERPGATLRLEPFDLREVAERLSGALRPRAAESGLALALEGGAPAPVIADRQRIEQVLANLLDNALKYTERGGVTVRLGAEAAGSWCEIEDSGVGIPAADLPRIFERFYRVEKGRSRERGGTGLGLSIVKHVVTLHGGEITVRSEPGVGTRFRFVIPRRPAPALPSSR